MLKFNMTDFKSIVEQIAGRGCSTLHLVCLEHVEESVHLPVLTTVVDPIV